MTAEKLTEPQIYEALRWLSGWSYEEHSLVSTYEFDSFLEAVSFINDLVPICEEMWHHPDIDIKYSEVTLSITTHDLGGVVSTKDVTLARAIEDLVV